ncbi:MAG: hypothetical protein ACI8RD_014609, partial [Bacillariaceae sp.]
SYFTTTQECREGFRVNPSPKLPRLVKLVTCKKRDDD